MGKQKKYQCGGSDDILNLTLATDPGSVGWRCQTVQSDSRPCTNVYKYTSKHNLLSPSAKSSEKTLSAAIVWPSFMYFQVYGMYLLVFVATHFEYIRYVPSGFCRYPFCIPRGICYCNICSAYFCTYCITVCMYSYLLGSIATRCEAHTFYLRLRMYSLLRTRLVKIHGSWGQPW